MKRQHEEFGLKFGISPATILTLAKNSATAIIEMQFDFPFQNNCVIYTFGDMHRGRAGKHFVEFQDCAYFVDFSK